MVVVCAPLRPHALSMALRRLREAICREAMAYIVPPAELEEILWSALLAVPAGLDGRALERRLLAEVRQALAAWRDTMALWDRRSAEFTKAMEEGGIVAREKTPRGRNRRR